jgi:DNA-binding NtrC family response regulator
LRTRGGDIVKIAEAVSASACERMGLPGKTLSVQFGNALLGYPWPGNVRELQHAVECAVVTAGKSKSIDAVHLPLQIRIHLARASVRPELNHSPARSTGDERPTLAQVRDAASAAYLAELLEEVHGDIEAACAIADVSRSRLYGLLKMYCIGRAARLKSDQRPVMAELGCEIS